MKSLLITQAVLRRGWGLRQPSVSCSDRERGLLRRRTSQNSNGLAAEMLRALLLAGAGTEFCQNGEILEL